MVQADVAMFTALSHYFAGIAQMQRVEVADDRSSAIRVAAGEFESTLEQLEKIGEHETQIRALADPIDFNAFFMRRHQVASLDTLELRDAVTELLVDTRDGFYPASGFGQLNRIIARIMANMEQNARIEGVISKFENFQGDSST
jgi:hypothetical protein